MSQIITYQQKTIHYQDTGKGPAIVLLHGFLESLDMWEEYAKRLSGDFRVVSIDLPGFGKSEMLAEIHTMEILADSVKAVLDQLKISECVMIGHSMGGYIDLVFAEKYPEMIKGIGIFHSHAGEDNAEGKRNRNRAISAIQNNHVGFAREFIQDLFAPSNLERLSKEIQVLKDKASEISKEAIIAAMAGMRDRTSKLHVLQQTDVPVLFIAGRQDKRIPLDKVMEQATLPIHSDILVLGNIGHMGFLEAKEICLRKIKNFTELCYDLKPV